MGRRNLSRIFSRSRVILAAHILVIGVIVLSLSSYLLSAGVYPFDLFSHFQLQYVGVVAILTVTLVWLRQYRIAAGAICYVVLMVVFVLWPIEIVPSRVDDTDVLFMNVYGKKRVNMEPIVDEILSRDPEVVAIVEANDDIIGPLSSVYGPPRVSGRKSYLHCVIFSKEPPTDVRSITEFHTPICQATFDRYTLVVIHTYSPIRRTAWKYNQEDLRSISRYMKKLEAQDNPFLVVGDFNATFFSPAFRSQYRQYFHKHLYTWEPYNMTMLPLDYAFTNMNITYHRTPTHTSDHAGLVIDLPVQ